MTPEAERRPSRLVATAWNVVFAYGAIVLALIRSLALVPVFLYYIDAREFGAWLATGGVLAYLLMLDFGLMGVVGQRIAHAYGARDFELLGRRVGTSLLLSLGIAAASAVLIVVVAPQVPGLMGLTGDAAVRLRGSFLIVGLANSINLVALAARAVLRSLQRPVIPGVSELVGELLGIVLTLVLLVQGFGLYAVAWGLAARGLLTFVVNLTGCLWASARLFRLRLGWDADEARGIWGHSVYLFFTTIAVRLQARSDAFFVGWILGPESALVYALTLRAHETIRLVTTQLIAGAQPSLAHLHGDRHESRFRQVLMTLLGITAVLSAIGMSGVSAFNGAFVGLWVGPELFGGLLLTVLAAAHGFVADLGSPQYSTLVATGEFRRLSRVVWAATLLRLPLLLLFLGWFGLPGAALAALVSGLIQTWRLTVAASKVLSLRLPDFRLSLGVAVRAALPAAALAALVLGANLALGGWFELIAVAALYSVAAGLLVAGANRGFVRLVWKEIQGLRATARAG